MSLLKQLRSDPDAVRAAAALAESKRLAELAAVDGGSVAIAATVAALCPAFTLADIREIEPPVIYAIPASGRLAEHLPAWMRGMPVVQFHEGDWPMGRLGVGQRSVAAGGAASSNQPTELADIAKPTMPAFPCSHCGGAFYWQALGDPAGEQLHCCACVAIPSRRMATKLWQVVAMGDGQRRGEPCEAWPTGATWEPWRAIYWRPFAKIESEEAERAEKESAKIQDENGGF